MTEDKIRKLSLDGLFRGKRIRGEVIETHISWVILTKGHAFKIKKPVKFTFLDFSTIKLRKKFCRIEVRLNSRLSNIYQTVLAVRYHDGIYVIDGRKGTIVDYVVVMKRVSSAFQMDTMLRDHRVSEDHIRRLARTIASFHTRATVIKSPFSPQQARKLFNDIRDFSGLLKDKVGNKYASMIERSISWSDGFVKQHENRFAARVNLGYKRDVHGDLHTGNVFLLRHPVIFDCIEFNPMFRQIDVLYEVAFMAMDLEAFGSKNLSNLFVSEYLKRFRAIRTAEDAAIFQYFKCLRANVRTKVHLISLSQADNPKAARYHLAEARKYLRLIKGYTLGNTGRF